MRVDLLGPMHVQVDGETLDVRGPIRRSLLALLAVRANQIVSVEHLADALWEGTPPRAASGTIRTYVSQLRTQLGGHAGRLTTEHGGYRLALDDDELDVRRFERACSAHAADGHTDAEAAERLEAALALWRGAALDGFRGSPWADVEAARLEELRVTAIERWATTAVALGAHEEVVRALLPLRTEHPYREDLRRHLIVALYASGRQVEALAEYSDLRTRLVDDLGLEPTANMRALEAAILRHDLDVAGPPRNERADERSSRVVTFMVTDLVDSTPLWEQDPLDAVHVVRRYLDAVDATVAAHGGTTFRATGDGACAVFDRAADAGGAALAILRAGTDDRPPVRIALYTGEAHPVGDDWFGRAVDRCARLCSLTHAEQVLVGATTALMMRDELPVGCRLVDRGPVALRGAPEPEIIHELVAAPAQGFAPDPGRIDDVDFPDLLDAALGGPVVGREGALEQLRRTAAGSHQAHLALIIGEPGIGKTTIAAVFARERHDAGALVVCGRGREEVAVPYEPLLGALEPIVSAAAPDERRSVEALRHLSANGGAVATDAVVARAYDALSRALAAASGQREVVIVLDDLQWTSNQTWVLLRHLVRAHPADAGRVLVIGTVRDIDHSGGDPVAGVVAELPARGLGTVIALDGLDLDEVGQLVAVLGHAQRSSAPEGEVDGIAIEVSHASLRAATGGNPFLLGQALAGFGGTDAGEAVRWRLDQLTAPTRAVLGVAAVVGQSFRVPLVEHAHGADVLDALDEAVSARLVREEPATPGGYELVHGLVRDALLSGLSVARRARLHHRVAEALMAVELRWTTVTVERWWSSPLAWSTATASLAVSPADHATVALLAHHLLEAVADGAARPALLIGILAGRLSLEVSDPVAAIGMVERCLPLVDSQPPDERARLEVHLLLTRWATHLTASDNDKATALGDELIEVARSSGDPEALAQAVVATTGSARLPDAEHNRALCLEALDAVGPDDGPSRAILLGLLALNQSLTSEWHDASAIAAEGVRVARRIGFDRALIPNLLILGSVLGHGPESLPARREIADELLTRAEQGGDPELRVSAARLGIITAIESADAAAIDRALEHVGRACADVPAQVFPEALRSMWQGMLAHARGDFDAADAAAQHILEIAHYDANLIASAQALRFAVVLDRGETDRLGPALDDLAVSAGPLLFAEVARAAVASATGRDDEAAALVEQLTAAGVGALPTDPTWGGAVMLLADVARSVGRPQLRRDLVDLLEVRAGVLVVNSWGVLCHGAADHYRGALLTDLGELDAGIDLLERGLELEDRIGARTAASRTRVDLAGALLQRDHDGDHARARAIATEARADAHSIGMRLVAAEADRLVTEAGAEAGRSPNKSTPSRNASSRGT